MSAVFNVVRCLGQHIHKLNLSPPGEKLLIAPSGRSLHHVFVVAFFSAIEVHA